MFDRELYNAAKDGDVVSVREYLDQGANPNAIIDQTSKMTAIHEAAYHLHINVMIELLKDTNHIRANIRQEEKYGGNALHKTVSCDTNLPSFQKAAMIQLLHQTDNDIINVKSIVKKETPIYWAIHNGDANSVFILRALGANCNTSYNGETANKKAKSSTPEVQRAMQLNVTEVLDYYHRLISEYQESTTMSATVNETADSVPSSLSVDHNLNGPSIVYSFNSLEVRLFDALTTRLDATASRIEDNFNTSLSEVVYVIGAMNSAIHDC